MLMLSIFPQLFFLTPLAIALLRVAAGVVFLCAAWMLVKGRAELSQITFIVIGSGSWIPLLAAAVNLGLGVLLVVGFYTQAAAIVGALLSLKALVWHRRYPRFFPLGGTAYALIAVISLALIATGAGAFAFDLPL